MAEKEINEVVYTIPLRALQRCPRTKRAPKAIKLIKEYVARHRKAGMEDIWIDKDVNEMIWARGIEKPPNKVTLKVAWIEDEDLVEVLLPDIDE
ncbi:MAG: 50S ribosomal protein L31e [Candidatus Heimdallarchaeota archaeon]|nr:50S ribosomal protein L31e [Candidatus Heimdallarchaeota archaeon]